MSFAIRLSIRRDIFQFLPHSLSPVAHTHSAEEIYEDLNYRLKRILLPFMKTIQWQFDSHIRIFSPTKWPSQAIKCKYKMRYCNFHHWNGSMVCGGVCVLLAWESPENRRIGLRRWEREKSSLCVWCSACSTKKIMLGDVKSNRSKIFNDDISNMQMKFNERG